MKNIYSKLMIISSVILFNNIGATESAEYYVDIANKTGKEITITYETLVAGTKSTTIAPNSPIKRLKLETTPGINYSMQVEGFGPYFIYPYSIGFNTEIRVQGQRDEWGNINKKTLCFEIAQTDKGSVSLLNILK